MSYLDIRSKCRMAAVDAALESGFFIKRSVGKISSISYKGSNNIVTDIDKKAEEIILKKLRRVFPDHSILSEERHPIDTGSPYKWIIDPIDGTTNFAHAFPFFSVSIALEWRGSLILGVVYDPMRNELFMAERERGAACGKRRISVSAVRDLRHSFLATGFAYGIRDARNMNIRNFGRLLKRSLAIRRAGSAALDLCYVACGRFDGFWELDLRPWDSAAGALIVREAGGIVTDFQGRSYAPYHRQILATNGLIHRQMLKAIS